MGTFFSGQLNRNEIQNALFNMIISITTFADNISGLDSSLVEKNRVDGSLYGDTKLYIATDVGETTNWKGDLDTNVLELKRPKSPKTQAITVSVFRQIQVTVDNYLSKRAFADEYAFSTYTGVVLQWLTDTKKVYDYTVFNSFIGTNKSPNATQNIELVLPINDNPEVQNRLRGELMSAEIAKLMARLQDTSRDYNDLKFLRAYNPEDIRVVWNIDRIIEINKLDLPTIFHKEGLLEKMTGDTLPARFFGDILPGGTVPGSATALPKTNKTIRSLIEINIADPAHSEDRNYDNHFFPGDLLPDGYTYGENEAYEEKAEILCKIMHKKSTPYMSAFQTGTEFWNPKSLTSNHYLTWGHNKLEHIMQYPYITITTKEAVAGAAKK